MNERRKYTKEDKIKFLVLQQGWRDEEEIAEVCNASLTHVKTTMRELRKNGKLAGRNVG